MFNKRVKMHWKIIVICYCMNEILWFQIDGVSLLCGSIRHWLEQGDQCPHVFVSTHFHGIIHQHLLPKSPGIKYLVSAHTPLIFTPFLMSVSCKDVHMVRWHTILCMLTRCTASYLLFLHKVIWLLGLTAVSSSKCYVISFGLCVSVNLTIWGSVCCCFVYFLIFSMRYMVCM